MKALIVIFVFLISLAGYSQELPEANKKVLEYAKSKLGQRVGNGVCVTLIDSALRYANPGFKKDPKAYHSPYHGAGRNIPVKKAEAGDIVCYYRVKTREGIYIESHVEILYNKNADGTWDTISQNVGVEKLQDSKTVIVKNVRLIPVGGLILVCHPY